MGKEQDLLEAARAGNLSLAERLLAARARLSGPLASLRRGPGANVQDSSGYTPLHHAALNGHKDIVQLLLSYEASTNILDTKGSSPLHLAAWAGHTGIVRLLLSHGPALTNVNLTTRDKESALHCAAQYGHTDVVFMLLQHGADPTVRSVRDETALDLASQYGRLETVELLVKTHPELLEPYRNPRGILPHTPLHRASKNGHKAVVVVLLKAGHAVNALTGAGAPLHEAALCGKTNVVRALLARGADPRIRDRAGDTVLDALSRFPPHVTHDIVALINKYRLSNGFDSDAEELPRIPVHQHDGLNSPYDNVQPQAGSGHHRGHIWERREDDERRVSGTSALSMNYQRDLVPASHSNIPANSHHHPNVMLGLASKCFGVKQPLSETQTLPYSKSTDMKKQKKSKKKEKSSAHPPKTGFFRKTFGIFSSNSNVDSESEKKEERLWKTASLPDILDNPLNAHLDFGSESSIVSVSNSIYGSARNSHSFAQLPETLEDPVNHVYEEYSVTDSIDYINNFDFDSFNQSIGNQNTVLPKIFSRQNSTKITYTKIAPSSSSNNLVEAPKPKTNVPKSKSYNYDKKPPPNLYISHSVRSPKNWSSDNLYFKNDKPIYFSSSNLESSGHNNLYYAMLDFHNSDKVGHVEEPNNDYEPYDFTEAKAKVQNEKRNIFKPIEVFHENSTVFVDVNTLTSPKKLTENKKDANRFLLLDSLVFEGVTIDSKTEKYSTGSLSAKPIPAPHKTTTPRLSSQVSTVTRYSSFLENQDLHNMISKFHESSTRTSIDESVEQRTHGNVSKTISTSVIPPISTRSSINTIVEKDSDSSSFGSRPESDEYMDIRTVMNFSERISQLASQTASLGTLKHIADEDDPVYDNVDFPQPKKSQPVAKPHESVYHMRGSQNCIYDVPHPSKYIYVFNKESLTNMDVHPFTRISRDDLTDLDIRNICFCGPEQKNIYMSTKDINANVVQELYSHYQARLAELSNEDTFTCYCDNINCEFHHTKSIFKSNSAVTYSAHTNSVSIPNTKLSLYTDEKPDPEAKSEFETKYNLSAFVPSPNRNSFDLEAASSISFRSVLEDPIDEVEPETFRLSNLSLYSHASSFGEFHKIMSSTTDAGSLYSPVFEGGRSLCVRSGSDGGHYPYSKSSGMDGSYHSEELSSSYQSGKIREPDQLSISSTTSSTGGPSPRERQRCGTNESSVSGQGIYMSMGASQGYHAHSPGSNTKVSPTPPKKPPRRNLSVSPTHLLPPGSVLDSLNSNQRSHHLARTGQTRSQDDLDDLDPETKTTGLRHGRSVDHYVDSKVSPRTKPVPQPRPSLALLASRRDQPVAINAMYENVVIKEQNPRRKLRRNTQQQQQYDSSQPREANNGKYHSSQERSSLESLLDDASSSYHGGTPSDGEPVGYGRSSQNTPLSPTHYNQPPTPDHPPPSAKQAEMSIHERIRPLSQEYKRMSRDMETETDPRFLARSSSPASSASTDHCVEEYVAEVPFAGLFKGSTTTLDGIGVRPVPAERPKSLRKLKNVYDNGIQGLGIGTAGNRSKEIQPGTRIDPDVDPWQYRHVEDKDQISNPPSSASLDKPLSMLSPFDEQEEWAKINEIMASFGSRLVRESVFAEELEQEFQSRLGARFSCSESSLSPCAPAGPSVLSWLTGLGLQHLESNFVNNGYDHVDFINGVIEDSDLAEMAIEEPEKTKVLDSCKSLPNKIDEVLSVSTVKSQSNINNNNNISNNNVDKEIENDPEAVNKWLTSIGLECYQETFRKHLYTDMERVRRIWEVELTAVLEIQKVGHRRRILASVAGRQNGPINNIEDLKALNTLEKNIQSLNAEIKEKLPDLASAITATTITSTAQTNHIKSNADQAAKSSTAPTQNQLTTPGPGGETLKRSHKKNRPPPPPPARGVDLEIRAPCALMVGVPGTLCTQWKHQPLSLVTGSVMYVANYLGSTIVKELRGKESTQKSIQKLKKSTNEPRALPDIILSISYRGVKFLNTITRNLVCEHEIRNIHCACQDADDLTHFAYITKDITTKSHYCHVFCVATMDQATEVILTLGQAFEVAYQMALRESSSRSNTLQRQHQQQQGQQGQQVRSQSSNQISQQAKTPTHEKASNGSKDRPNPVHGRSHSVTEIKLNGHQLKVAPITVSLSNEDFQSTSKNGDVQKSPRTPSAKAPIALAEEL